MGEPGAPLRAATQPIELAEARFGHMDTGILSRCANVDQADRRADEISRRTNAKEIFDVLVKECRVQKSTPCVRSGRLINR
jgi:hypothetical protein